eukprot:gene11897-13131_t
MSDKFKELQRQLVWLEDNRARLDQIFIRKLDGAQILDNPLNESEQEVGRLKQKQQDTSQRKFPPRQSASCPESAVGFSRKEEIIPRGRDHSDSTEKSSWTVMQEIRNKERADDIERLRKRNDELTTKVKSFLHELSSGDGRNVDSESFRTLRRQLEEYKQLSSVQVSSDAVAFFGDEAQRLSTELSNRGIQKTARLGKSQNEIDVLNPELKALELRKNKDDDTQNYQRSLSAPVTPIDDLLKYPFDSFDELCAREKPLLFDQQPPVVKPRTDNKELVELKNENAKLVKALADIKSQIEYLESEKTEMVKVNHAWDAQYRKLQEHMKSELQTKDKTFHALQKQLSQEHKDHSRADYNRLLEQKDLIIEEQAAKIRALKEELGKARLDSMRYMQNQYENDMEQRYQRAKKLFQDQKKENEIVLKREQALGEECQMLKDAVEVLERQLHKLSSRNKMLETELQRLASLVENFAAGKQESVQSGYVPASLLTNEGSTGVRQQHSLVSAEEIEVLKQQISIYTEDFNSEKEEKEKLQTENKRLKERLHNSERETEEWKRQMQIIESDFRLEREERLNLEKAKQQADPFLAGRDELAAHVWGAPSQPGPDLFRQYHEYCRLIIAKDKMNKRIAELEQRGVDKLLQEQQQRDLFVGQRNAAYIPRAQNLRPAATPEQQSEERMFFGGDVVKDDHHGLSSPSSQHLDESLFVCHNCQLQFANKGQLVHHSVFCKK